MAKQTLAQGIIGLHAAVDRFKAYCEREMKAHPEHWPAQLSDGEWFEQFLSFATSGEDEGAAQCDECGAAHAPGQNTLCPN